MKIVVAIEVEALDAAQVELLLKDALGEFVVARTPITDYVGQRYTDQDETFRIRKADEVRVRLNLAERIKAALKVDVALEEHVDGPSEAEIAAAHAETKPTWKGNKSFKDGRLYTKIVLIKVVRNARGIDLMKAKTLVDLWERRGLL